MMKKFLVRLNALTVKEFRQIMRDPSSILIGLILPCVLIFIFGYGLSLDVNNIPVAVVIPGFGSSGNTGLSSPPHATAISIARGNTAQSNFFIVGIRLLGVGRPIKAAQPKDSIARLRTRYYI